MNKNENILIFGLQNGNTWKRANVICIFFIIKMRKFLPLNGQEIKIDSTIFSNVTTYK